MDKVSGGSQYLVYGKSHYERNKQKYIEKADKRRRENWKLLTEYKKTLSCKDCSNSDFRVLEFDHLPGTKTGKKMEISSLTNRGWSWKNILIEIAKCEPVCSNCHTIRTWERLHAGVM